MAQRTELKISSQQTMHSEVPVIEVASENKFFDSHQPRTSQLPGLKNSLVRKESKMRIAHSQLPKFGKLNFRK